ncbi:MAG: sigmaK-factor processing regulatory BofA [Methanomicrobiales archaeon HGW-Methanomicrobiales-4]|nr:MAG: sigmaK-factor processing regulatory BofA [Methanomicrobiales archaeon HGW-Methanomicrobiales-4]
MIGTLIVLILGIIILAALWFLVKNVMHLVINSILGIALLFLVNLINLFGIIGKPGIPIDLVSLIVCALAGIPGAILLMLLHIVGLY